MDKYELNKYLQLFKKTIINLKTSLNFEVLKQEVEGLLKQQWQENFWDNVEEAQKIINETQDKKEKVDKIIEFEKSLNSLQELADSLKDEELRLLADDVLSLDKELKSFMVITLYNGPYDKNNCFLEIHPGAGGTESQDWGAMLYRMYLRYASKMKYQVEVIDYQAGDEAGIKSVALKIKGKYAYGNLKGEMGVHRLVRISPFDSNKRRHTSFASVEVLPEIKEAVNLNINEEELKIDVYRSGGAGGQSVNTTDSAVRVTHLPSGLVVTCQNERSQLKNKETALSILKNKLLQLQLKEQQEKLDKLKGDQKEIAWGSQIRSYVFHPYQMVKDHRTNEETSQVEAVMDGELEIFINSYLRGNYGSS
ncbi:MAG: peptide chain release factor 2 [Acholeplasmatales bacterium]|jgi:peptide chain release factor 2|nr:peptide chain release factor 2 [Acholeplasmataceae bacterium]MDY0114960.1 peptide chain release factor 2 [Acholeplasmatales bacterium]MCK9233873.1 peptide chain release factor 2 [Acholeplasmataceae bacterium]MCK9289136.1 peptide chain release factor 2 [Acholeplasmataceae bacterium]MCK9427100.1 peptide chain release factor 2 [Acholeplasmataceae bacterium]